MSYEHTGSFYAHSNSYGGWGINFDKKLPSRNILSPAVSYWRLMWWIFDRSRRSGYSLIACSGVGTGEAGGGSYPSPNISGGGAMTPPPIFQCTPNELVLYIVHTTVHS